MNKPFTIEDSDLLAALIFDRFNQDHHAARAAWSRMLENEGWDDDEYGRKVWEEMVVRGQKMLREVGLRGLREKPRRKFAEIPDVVYPPQN